MTRLRLFIYIAAMIAAFGCGSTSPSAPTPAPNPAPSPAPNPTPNPSTWTLSGKVTESAPTDTQVIGGASVTIVDGPNAGKSATTDAGGNFSFPGLTQGTFNVDANAPGYQKKTLNVALTSNQTLTFTLSPVLKMIDDQVSNTVSGTSSVCDSADAAARRPCFKYLIGAHNDGPVTAVLTWTDAAGNSTPGGTLALELDREPGTGATDRIASAAAGSAGSLQLSATITGGAMYSVRVLYRGGTAAQPFTLHVTRPN